jgi:transposase, IS5 family
MQEIQRMTTRQRQEQQREAYRSLIGIAEEVVESSQVVLQNTGTANGKDMFARNRGVN